MNKNLVLPTLCVSRRLPFADSSLKYMLICVLPVVLLSKFSKVKPPFHIALPYRQKAWQLRETPHNTRWIQTSGMVWLHTPMRGLLGQGCSITAP